MPEPETPARAAERPMAERHEWESAISVNGGTRCFVERLLSGRFFSDSTREQVYDELLRVVAERDRLAERLAPLEQMLEAEKEGPSAEDFADLKNSEARYRALAWRMRDALADCLPWLPQQAGALPRKVEELIGAEPEGLRP